MTRASCNLRGAASAVRIYRTYHCTIQSPPCVASAADLVITMKRFNEALSTKFTCFFEFDDLAGGICVGGETYDFSFVVSSKERIVATLNCVDGSLRLDCVKSWHYARNVAKVVETAMAKTHPDRPLHACCYTIREVSASVSIPFYIPSLDRNVFSSVMQLSSSISSHASAIAGGQRVFWNVNVHASPQCDQRTIVCDRVEVATDVPHPPASTATAKEDVVVRGWRVGVVINMEAPCIDMVAMSPVAGGSVVDAEGDALQASKVSLIRAVVDLEGAIDAYQIKSVARAHKRITRAWDANLTRIMAVPSLSPDTVDKNADCQGKEEIGEEEDGHDDRHMFDYDATLAGPSPMTEDVVWVSADECMSGGGPTLLPPDDNDEEGKSRKEEEECCAFPRTPDDAAFERAWYIVDTSALVID
jgi:hypothetical protein